ncbi:MAG TPA: isochorismatase family cysteine hydrolase [Candidatus Polarisedimenticolia bacterium]|jgi:nicotinamidase/pyrazinamidase|nr:isochorismatase family cysteine hydrolase [Candidatus Polarisedimenticolia bacterium]
MAPRKLVFWQVDVQADFMLPGGKLYVPGAEKIIPKIQRLVSAAVEHGVMLVSSGDSHPENDPEFDTFPPHCLRGTPGARILPEGMTDNFRTIPNDASHKLPDDILRCPQIIFEKQTLDVFDNPHAGELVERLGGDREYVVFGVVTEYCVRLAAKGLLGRGRKVAIVKDAIEALNPEDGRRALDELQALGARMITTQEALAAVRAATAKASADSVRK